MLHPLMSCRVAVRLAVAQQLQRGLQRGQVSMLWQDCKALQVCRSLQLLTTALLKDQLKATCLQAVVTPLLTTRMHAHCDALMVVSVHLGATLCLVGSQTYCAGMAAMQLPWLA